MNSSKKIKMLCLFFGIAFLFIFIRENYPQRIWHSLTKKNLPVSEMNYWLNKDEVFRSLPIDTNSIVFFGTSLTDAFELNEYFPNGNVKNRGVAGDFCKQIIARSNEIIQAKPKKIFIEMGANDVLNGIGSDSVVSDFKLFCEKIKSSSPNTAVYLQSMLPVYAGKDNTLHSTKKCNKAIRYINEKVKGYASQKGITFIPLFEKFEKNGCLNSELSRDGVHLLGKGYDLWAKELLPYINE
jgi:lysophospholipase L1-like esterase